MVCSVACDTTIFEIDGGYVLTPLARLGNALSLFIRGDLNCQSFRVFLSLISMQAARDAALKSGRRTGEGVCFQIVEIQERIPELSRRRAQRALNSLQAAGVARFSQDAITFADEPLPLVQASLEAISGGRSLTRRVPIPRRVLEHLCRCKQPTLLRAAVLYLVRGLTLRRGGEINLAGSVKSSWIAQVAGMSLRSAKTARRCLIALGLISQDSDSTQHKLNRTGSYFLVNPHWTPPNATKGQGSASPGAVNPSVPLTPLHEVQESQPGEISCVPAPEFAPLPGQNCTQIAPPIKNKRSYLKEKNQRTVPLNQAGVYQQVIRTKAQPAKAKGPTLQCIEHVDLTHLDRLEVLYWQAIQKRWLAHSEANILNFIGAAVRARQVTQEGKKGYPVRVFVSLVKSKRWAYITQAQEEYARDALNRHRQALPDIFRRPRESPQDGALRGSTSNVPQFLRSFIGAFASKK